MAFEDFTTGEIIIGARKVFMTDVDPEDDAKTGDVWHDSSDVLKIRNYDQDGWLTVLKV